MQSGIRVDEGDPVNIPKDLIPAHLDRIRQWAVVGVTSEFTNLRGFVDGIGDEIWDAVDLVRSEE